jgi:hypothetical protein
MTPRRFRRLGMTSMALSVTASALVLGSALPAAAAENAAVKPKKCAKGTDPKTTLENIACQVQNTVDDIKNKIDNSNKPQDVPEKKPPVKKKTPKKTLKRNTARYSAPVQVPVPVSPDSTVPLSRPEALKQVPKLPSVSDVLPSQPQVAPQSTATIAAAPETHLVSPVASVTSTDDGTALWVAGASGLAAGIVMLQFSLIGARLRRRLPE